MSSKYFKRFRWMNSSTTCVNPIPHSHSPKITKLINQSFIFPMSVFMTGDLSPWQNLPACIISAYLMWGSGNFWRRNKRMANVVLGPVGAAPGAGRRVRGLCLPDGCLASLDSRGNTCLPSWGWASEGMRMRAHIQDRVKKYQQLFLIF